MDTTTIIIIVVLVLAIVGAIVGPLLARRRRSKQLHNQYGSEYDRTVQALGTEKKAQAELKERQKHINTLEIRPLSMDERQRYQTDWAAVQAEFVDQPGKATQDADHLIMEVMQLRDYPVSDFEQRAADVSIQYPALVSNYRAARDIAVKNEHNEAGTEELRQAMIYYRSLFNELLKAETVTS
jgi:hypothetical protein